MDLFTVIRTAAAMGAAKAFEDAGLTSGEISQKEATRIYGTFFTKAAAAGRLLPVRTGTARNSKKVYRVADILALRCADEAEAFLLDINHQNQTI